MRRPFVSRIIPFLKARYAPRGARLSFSASGEDIIISTALARRGVKKVLYVDVGAHHPIFGNNTYLFYRNHGQGVLVEPNGALCKTIRKKRPKDICLHAGVGTNNGESTFFTFIRSTRNTFSPNEALAWERQSGEKAKEEKQRIFSLDYILDVYCDRVPDVVSIDAEGYDFKIIAGFSWKKRPKIFCIEASASSGSYDTHNEGGDIYSLLQKNGYSLLARTPANAIFADMEKIAR
ncbi:FkbM family methyltransferase [bacterium]|nr:FkbM family methyltransferase [bacterium]